MLFKILMTAIPLLLSIGLGWALLSAFFPSVARSKIEKGVLSLGLGLGVITYLQALMLTAGIQLTRLNLVGIILFLTLSLLPFLHQTPSVKKQRQTSPFDLLSKIIRVLIIVQITYVFVKAFNLPMFVDDAIVVWGQKAKIIFYSNELGHSLGEMAKQMHTSLNGHYPLLLPLAEAFINIFLGEWSDLYPKILFPLFYLLLLMTFYYFSSRFIDRKYALIFTFMMGSLRFLSGTATWAIADVLFTYYYFISFMLLLLWIRDQKNPYLFLSAIFSGLAIWTKNEGYPSFLINVLVLVFFLALQHRHRLKEQMPSLMIYALLILPVLIWVPYYQSLTGVEDQVINSHTLTLSYLIQTVKKLPLVLSTFGRQLFLDLGFWNMMGGLCLLTLFLNVKSSFTTFRRYALLAIVANIGLYVCVYLVSPIQIEYQMKTSLDRLILHFVPIIFFYMASVWGKQVAPNT